jgi:hypothetical protein
MRHGLLRFATGALQQADPAKLNQRELSEALLRRPNRVDERQIIPCLSARGAEWIANTWGQRRSWTFSSTYGFADLLRLLLTAALTEDSAGWNVAVLKRYQASARLLMARTSDPYPSCGTICAGPLANLCLYRDAGALALERDDITASWDDARKLDDDPAISGYPTTWATCTDIVAAEMLGPEPDPEARRAAALCYAQQAVAGESPSWPPWLRKDFVLNLIDHAEADRMLDAKPAEVHKTDTSPNSTPARPQ